MAADELDQDLRRLGGTDHDSPLAAETTRFVSDSCRILRSAQSADIHEDIRDARMPPSFEQAGPRARLHFAPGQAQAGIVTCGGICPGLNNVIRALVLTLWHHYRCEDVLGFRYGYTGLTAAPPEPPIPLTPDAFVGAMSRGGTMLGTSRGPQDIDEMIDSLVRHNRNVLFCVGGDGTLRGAWAIEERLRERGLPISVVAVPKTIDNDIQHVERSFGFTTAVDEATRAITSAHFEAQATLNGVGLVKLMGRHAGYIAAAATLARTDVNFCLVPECPIPLEGPGGLLDAIERRLDRRRHAVLVVAEGFGQDLMLGDSERELDASGNVKLADIGPFLKKKIQEHMAKKQKPLSLKYIDPSYMIRSVPARGFDAELCHIFGQHAVHAAMTGRSGLMIGHINQHFVHVPLPEAIRVPRRIRTTDPIWQRVLEATGQNSYLQPATPVRGQH
ncbi:MAG: ATP-dependent 6-phosphofructokinase [Planctomycetota bacterium]